MKKAIIGAVAILAAALSLLAISPAAEAATHPLSIGFGDEAYRADSASERERALNLTRSVNGKIVRLAVDWRSIAPQERPPHFTPTDPGSPGYAWSRLDAQVRQASNRGFRVMLLVQFAPAWAEGKHRPNWAEPGSWKPKPDALADFATALARRYSGHYRGLPQVRDYLCWGEANLRVRLTPLWGGKNGKKPVAPLVYKKMLNAFYDAVHAVNPSNTVVSAQLAPHGAKPGLVNMRPLLWWRTLLCIKDNKRLSATKHCKKPKFDVLAHNPITTNGGPGVSERDPDDVATADLHNLVDVLRAAEKHHNVLPRGHRPVWATELWWETNPPDPAKPNPNLEVQADWYTQSLYSLWKQGASVVLFLQVIDHPYNGRPGRVTDNYQSGLYFADGRAKPSAAAVRFPFVADRQSKNQVLLWGLAPKSGTVSIQQNGKSGTVTTIQAKAGAVFQKRINLSGGGQLRATIGGEQSPFWTIK